MNLERSGGAIMKLHEESRLTLYPLQIRPDKKHFIVEDEVTGEFYEMPKVCIDAIEQLNQGKSLRKVEAQLLQAYPSEEVDMMDFANQLIEYGLVKEIDGQATESVKKTQSVSGMGWLSPRLGRLFFNPISNTIYSIFFIMNITLMILHPELLPHYRDIFLVDSMLLNVFIYAAISFLFLMIHEFGHMLAIRSYGLPTKLSIGHRLFFIVLETDLTSAWKLAPRERLKLYLGGMAFEQVILSTTILLSLALGGSTSFWVSVLPIIIFDISMKTIYQCCIYMKTDLYYVVENITGCYNLMENSKQSLSKWLPFLKQKEQTKPFTGESLTIHLYSIIYLIGLPLTIIIALNWG
jgi:putative peptide zinc metalloprotease protein